MAQSQTGITTRTNTNPNNTLNKEEINTIISTADTNSSDFETRMGQSESDIQEIDQRTKVIEDTNVGNIQSYSSGNLPSNVSNGTMAFATDLGVPVYQDNGVWRKASDDTVVTDQNTLDVYVVIGQSNAEGFNFWANLDTNLQNVDRTNTRMYLSTITNGTTWNAGQIEPIDPPNNTSWEFGGFGPEVGFSDEILNRVSQSDPIFNKLPLMIKFAKGGTSLKYDWDPNFSNNYMYDGMISMFQDLPGKLLSAGKVGNYKGVIWFQGEQDSFDQTSAQEYEANLNAFIAQVRSVLTNPILPFVIAKIKWETGNDPGFETEVRNAQQAVADNDPNVTILDAANYTRRDTVHLNANSSYQYGVDAVSAMEAAINGL